MVNRYFKKLFKSENKSIVRRRFVKVRQIEMLTAVKKMCTSHFLKSDSTLSTTNEEELHNLAVFLIHFMNYNPTIIDDVESDASARGKEIAS